MPLVHTHLEQRAVLPLWYCNLKVPLSVDKERCGTVSRNHSGEKGEQLTFVVGTTSLCTKFVLSHELVYEYNTERPDVPCTQCTAGMTTLCDCTVLWLCMYVYYSYSTSTVDCLLVQFYCHSMCTIVFCAVLCIVNILYISMAYIQ